MDGFSLTMDWLWPAALGVIPLSLIAWGVGRWGACRASTRHLLWLTVLLCFFVPPVLPAGELLPKGKPNPAALAPENKVETRVPSARAAETPEQAAKRLAALDSKQGPMPERVRRWFEETRRGSPAQLRTPPLEESALPLAALTHASPEKTAAPPASPPGVNGRAASSDKASTSPPSAAPRPRQPAVAESPRVVQRPADTAGPSTLPPGRPAGPAAPAPPGRMLLDAAKTWAGGVVRAWTAQAREWWALVPAAADIRAGVAGLPPVPSVVWFGGAGLLAVIVVVRAVALRRLLASARPAPPSVRRAVESAARSIGLRQAPETLMVHDRVSPTVVCWGRPRLVLPYELWEELDEQGRDAVVLHELAHLRRRDHWVCWAELAASALFWWHPVMWWARKKLREEADACCDAWVTMLLPRGRRSYAQALLNTRAYLSENGRAIPGVGLGVSSDSAERFARRLTMVMKERGRPGLTACGIALALALGLVGAAATPLWACPPEKTEQSEKARAQAEKAQAEVKKALTAAQRDQERARKEVEKVRAETQKMAEKQRAETDKHRAEAEKHRAEASQAREKAVAEAARVREKALADAGRQREKALAEAAQQRERSAATAAAQRERATAQAARQRDVAAARAARNDTGGADDRVRQLEQRLERLEEQLRRLEQALNRRAPRTMAPTAPMGGALAMEAPTPMPPLTAATPPAYPGTPVPPAPPPAPAADLPALVAPPAAPQTPAPPAQPAPTVRGGISYAAPTTDLLYSVTQPVLGSLLAGYQPEAGPVEARTYGLPEGKLESLVELMRRDDVPIFVSWNENSITVNATPAQHRIFAAFVKMIHPEAEIALEAGVFTQPLPHAIALSPAVEAMEADVAALTAAVQQLSTRVEVTASRAAALSSQADALEEQADALNEQADELAEQAEELEGDAADKLNAQADDLRAKSDDLRARSEELRSESEAAESEIEGLEAELEALQEAGDGDECDECCDSTECSGCAEGCEGECCETADEPEESEESDAPVAVKPIRQ